MEIDRRIDRVLSSQLGLITREQLSDHGVSRQQRRTMVAAGVLLPIGNRTFRAVGSRRTPEQRVLAACLEFDGYATHQTAAWLQGLADFRLVGPPQVVVARPRHEYRVDLARIRTSTNLSADDLTVVRGVPCLSVARTLFSLASIVPNELSLDLVATTVDQAIADGKASEAWLWARLEEIRCRGRNGVSVFEGILGARSPGSVTESWLEREALAVLQRAGLPLPVCQQRIEADGAFVARVDFAYLPNKVILEVSGHRHHRTVEQTIADAARRRQLTLLGYQVLEYTYRDVVDRPEVLVAETVEALGIRRAA